MKTAKSSSGKLAEFSTSQPVTGLTIQDFSFLKSRRLLKNLRTSLQQAVIEERRPNNESLS
ncbi:hypothetical protein [Dyadobacter sp. Leaf189]|uniref:hypothetical protein n=1 Tax=Dyadobacter sp. Leaf189 TaxID=1736295 RepID=UPI0006FDB23F|nr:hypothetical protein [Dyadobacter sp. Leaf189]KQS27752.1 hypothetical protein ASG33_15080 [Dyadobacter sp. Leaf189]